LSAQMVTIDPVRKCRSWLTELSRNPLIDALVSSMLIVVVSKLSNDAFELILVQNEEMIQTFPHVLPHNTNAIRLYETLGFVHNPTIDVLFIQRAD